MPLALIAKITIDPKGILESLWIHDTAHVLLEARRVVLQRLPGLAAGLDGVPLPAEAFRRWHRP